MSRKRAIPGSPQDWLNRAKSNLALARLPKPEEALWEDWCFEAHQATEKAIKAVYQSRNLVFEYVHDIEVLWKGLEKAGLRVPPEIRESHRLTKYAFETRYPGPLEPVSENEYRKAFAIAEAVVKWAEKMVKASEDFPGSAVHETPAVYKAGQPRRKKRIETSNVLGKARKRFKAKGFNQGTIAQAVRWARKRRKK